YFFHKYIFSKSNKKLLNFFRSSVIYDFSTTGEAFTFLLKSKEIAAFSILIFPAIVSTTIVVSASSEILPWIPALVTILSPTFKLPSNSFSFLTLVCCGRIIKKYIAAIIKTKGKNCCIFSILNYSVTFAFTVNTSLPASVLVVNVMFLLCKPALVAENTTFIFADVPGLIGCSGFSG